MMDLNEFGKRTYECAVKRGKTCPQSKSHLMHQETIKGLHEEFCEVVSASEVEPSEHIEGFTAVAEELADIAIVVMTELHRRGVDIEAVLSLKATYNEQR